MSKEDRATVALDFPVQSDGVALSVLTMRRPKVRDLLAARKGSTDETLQELKLFSNLCEVAPEVIENLDVSDYYRLQEAYRGFRSGSQPSET